MAEESKAAQAAQQTAARNEGGRAATASRGNERREATGQRRGRQRRQDSRNAREIESVVAQVQSGSLRYRSGQERREFLEQRRRNAERRQKEKEQSIPDSIAAEEPALVPSRLRHIRNYYSHPWGFSNNRILALALAEYGMIDDCWHMLIQEVPAVIRDQNILRQINATAYARFNVMAKALEAARSAILDVYKEKGLSLKIADDPGAKLQIDTPPREFVFKFSEPGTSKFLSALAKLDTALAALHYLVMMGIYPEEDEAADIGRMIASVRAFTSFMRQFCQRLRSRMRRAGDNTISRQNASAPARRSGQQEAAPAEEPEEVRDEAVDAADGAQAGESGQETAAEEEAPEQEPEEEPEPGQDEAQESEPEPEPEPEPEQEAEAETETEPDPEPESAPKPKARARKAAKPRATRTRAKAKAE